MFFHLGRIVTRYRWLVDSCYRDCFTIYSTGYPGAAFRWLRQPRLRIGTGDYSASTEITGACCGLDGSSMGNFLTLGRGGRDWYSLQLNNDKELMLYLIRDATGKTNSTYVEYVGPQADVHLLPPGALRMDVLDHWKSPVIGVNFPSGWRQEKSAGQVVHSEGYVELTGFTQGSFSCLKNI